MWKEPLLWSLIEQNFCSWFGRLQGVLREMQVLDRAFLLLATSLLALR